MRTVRFIEGETRWPYARQSPRNDGVFGETQFLFGLGDVPAEWLVVLNGIPDDARLEFPKNRTIFLSGEPPAVRRFNADYLAQFGLAISVDPDLPHPNKLLLPPFLPWHVGVRTQEPGRYAGALTFSEIETAPQKSKLCSCITSTRSSSVGHRLRIAFVERLRERLGDRVDFFGRGIDELPDKEAGLAPYRYHIAIENSCVPNYWTEKLADPLLRNCYPIYYGAPDIADCFDVSSIAVIDITQPETAIDRIADLLASDIDQRSVATLVEAKRRVMWDHNILARLDRLIAGLENPAEGRAAPETILAESVFWERSMPWYLRFHSRFRRRLGRLRRTAR